MTTITAKDLSGGMTALVTPMKPNGEIDLPAWQQLIERQITAGIRAIIVAGTTGESVLLKQAELIELIKTAKAQINGRPMRLIVGTGGIDPAKVSEHNHIAHQNGADAVLVVTPYYLRISQAALIEHYQDLADNSELPLIIYNVPTRTGMDCRSETTKTLANHPNIIGIKEAKADLTRIEKLVTIKDFAVLSGDDDSFLKAMQKGANGVISVASNLYPAAIKNICDAIQLGDQATAKQIDNKLKPLYQLLACQPNPGPVKAALHQLQLIPSGIRKPLTLLQLNKQQQRLINQLNQEITT